MKKIIVSLLSGVLFGGTLIFFLENNPSSYIIFDQGGIDKRVVKEWDYNYLFNSSVIIIVVTSITYIILRVSEKKIMGKRN
ncbi:hypothetical protein [[Bacillus] enclensis]|uniref:hypothetical protein n=1 Tax=[Bacillus] enclensis TaxID=1402860 RepID=UPI0018DE50F7|nr:hypothetical protein [[Bacillus] enclensis]MBH9968902.1 hypothetical protein [[Bacillus] enclensis]